LKELPTNHLIPNLPELNLILDLYKKLYLSTPTFAQIADIQQIRNECREIDANLIKRHYNEPKPTR